MKNVIPPLRTADIELAMADYFNQARFVVPNVFWGMFDHELDLLVVTRAGYAYEVEIKVSLGDLKRDLDKRHGHRDRRIKFLYFAIPARLEKHIDLIPERAGVFVVTRKDFGTHWRDYVRLVRRPQHSGRGKPQPLNDDDILKAARLGALRIWGLKRTILELKRNTRKQRAKD